jgi:hypothetical protein
MPEYIHAESGNGLLCGRQASALQCKITSVGAAVKLWISVFISHICSAFASRTRLRSASRKVCVSRTLASSPQVTLTSSAIISSVWLFCFIVDMGKRGGRQKSGSSISYYGTANLRQIKQTVDHTFIGKITICKPSKCSRRWIASAA